MSWVARKVAGLDNEDQQQVIQNYFKQKQLLNEQTQQDQEVKKFWDEYGDEYFTGGNNG